MVPHPAKGDTSIQLAEEGESNLHKSGNELSLDLHKSGNELSLDLHKSSNELSWDLHKSE